VARIQPPDPGDVDPRLKPLFERFERERGATPNMFRTMGLRPEIAETAAAHMHAVFSTGTVDKRLKEMLAVRVSQINHCAY
jgi:alkylhydroperoxidase family enzyme